jgi:hypothetical protein
MVNAYLDPEKLDAAAEPAKPDDTNTMPGRG